MMLYPWWNYKNIIHYEVVLDNLTIDANIYSEQVRCMYAIVRQKYTVLVNRKRTLLQQDNAKFHTTRMTRNKLQEIDATPII